MSAPRIVAAGALDREGLVGTSGARASWARAGLDPSRRLRWRPLFAAPFPTFRRLDPLAQHACLAAEAAGLEGAFAALGEGARAETALWLGSSLGCLASDLRFARGLAPGAEVEPAVFPYTLPSTCLGELAIRHRLRGPTRALVSAPGAETEALAEAAAQVTTGEAAAALVCLGDCVAPDDAHGLGLAPRLGFVALLLAPGDAWAPEATARPAFDLPRIEELTAAPDPLALLTARLRSLVPEDTAPMPADVPEGTPARGSAP